MQRFFDVALRLWQDTGFLNFQNEIIHAAYESLGQAYAASENEVAIVTRLVNSVNGKSYDKVQISANKIHGSRSYVEFNFRDKPTTKELGDMAAISLVTAGKTRLLQRVCIIQNKKVKDRKWGLDPEQLFLLKNFPPFTGNRGIFRGMHDLVFPNRSGCLGAFGLISEPGEMMFMSAPVVAEFLRDRASLPACDIGLSTSVQQSGWQSFHPSGCLPFPPFDPDELYFILREALHRIGPFPWRGFGFDLPFLGNVNYGRDIYDFVRAWTQMNIGEFTCWNGAIINAEVDAFANHLIHSAGLGRGIDFPTDSRYVERKFEGDMAVLLLRVNVEYKG